MSLKKNILANYLSQIYVSLVGIVMVPVYVKYMGAEAYGLIGFYAMLQAWFQLLDVGLTPTMARESAKFQGGGSDASQLRQLLRALEGLFTAVALAGATLMIFAARPIATSWLKVEHLPLDEVICAIEIMGVTVALRWICGLYRGAITGFEQLVWLGGFNAVVATARFILVVPLFIFVGATPAHFFIFQLCVALAEAVTLFLKTYRLLPKIEIGVETLGFWNWSPLRRTLKFSLSIAFTGSIWVLVTQTDKLLLSKLLPLAQYAYFTLAVLMASGVLIVSGPVSTALLPRLTRMNYAGDDPGLLRLYRTGTQLVAAVAFPASLMLAAFAKEIIFAWTGDEAIANGAAPILRLYALGNGILSVSAFPYYLQYAKGNLRLHLIGSFLFVLVLIPSLIWATRTYGVVGAGFAWLFANTVYFICWIPFVHVRFFKNMHVRWLMRDVLCSFFLAGGAVLICRWICDEFLTWPDSRAAVALLICIFGSLVLLVSSAAVDGSGQIYRKLLIFRLANTR